MRKLIPALILGLSMTALFAAPLLADTASKGIKIIKTPQGEKQRTTWIKQVKFDHAMHQGAFECKTCHHMEADDATPKSYQKCTECHSDNSTNDPDGFYMAWHKQYVKGSCLGCHREMGAAKGCLNSCHPHS